MVAFYYYHKDVTLGTGSDMQNARVSCMVLSVKSSKRLSILSTGILCHFTGQLITDDSRPLHCLKMSGTSWPLMQCCVAEEQPTRLHSGKNLKTGTKKMWLVDTERLGNVHRHNSYGAFAAAVIEEYFSVQAKHSHHYFLFNFGRDDTFRLSTVSLAVLCFLFSLYVWGGTMFHVFVS